MKKAQMALMIILAVVVLFIFVLAFMLIGGRGGAEVPFESASLQGFVEDCIAQTTEDGLLLLGKQGGRITLREYVSAPSFGISYAAKDGSRTLPSAHEMEGGLAFFVKDNLGSCTEGFSQMEDQGWKVEEGDLSAVASINANDVSVIASYPLVFLLDDQRIALDTFSIKVPVRLSGIRNSAEHVADFSLAHNGSVDMAYLDGAGFNTTLFPYKGALIYRFSDEMSRIRDRPYEFFFAIS